MDTPTYLRIRAQAAAAAPQVAVALWQQVTEANPVDGRNWHRLAEAY